MAKKGGKDRGIFERPKDSGIWWVRYCDQNGREHREKVGPKGLALEVYRKRKTEVKEEKFFPDLAAQKRRRQTTVAAAIGRYMEESRSTKRSWKDDERYGRYWTEAIGQLTLEEVTPDHIERWRRQRKTERNRSGEKLKVATINRAVAFLKRVFHVAIDADLVDKNPVTKVKMYRENNERVRYLKDEEHEVERLEAAYNALPGGWANRWHTVQIARYTGIRQEEQASLRWEYIDFRHAVLRLPQSKHGEARTIALHDYALELLRALPSRLKSPWVYPGRKPDTHVSDRFLRKPFEVAVAAAGIENLHWHDMRHDFASRLVMNGTDLYEVQRLLGHKTAAMTQRYAHLSPNHLRKAVNRLPRPIIPESASAPESALTSTAI